MSIPGTLVLRLLCQTVGFIAQHFCCVAAGTGFGSCAAEWSLCRAGACYHSGGILVPSGTSVSHFREMLHTTY